MDSPSLTPTLIGRSTSQKGGRKRWAEYEIYQVGIGWYLKIWGRSTVPGEVDLLTEAAALDFDEVIDAFTRTGGWIPDTAHEAIRQAGNADRRLSHGGP